MLMVQPADCLSSFFLFIFFFRHLPMIAGLLHGRIHLNMQEFRQQNHMTFFSNVLAILELLQPLIFHSDHQRALQDCLLSFMKVLQVSDSHCLSKGLRSNINIFFNVIQIRVFLLVELSEDPFSVGLHQQVFAVHTEVHHPRCSSRHSLFTEAL